MNKLSFLTILKSIRDSLPEDRRGNFDLQYGGREKNTTVALVLSLFIGTLGVDRFYIGSIGLGILKLITFGGFGIWALIDWFLIIGAARKKNIVIANEVRALVA
jgi:TM2 domain-containing membrane protein YozV